MSSKKNGIVQSQVKIIEDGIKPKPKPQVTKYVETKVDTFVAKYNSTTKKIDEIKIDIDDAMGKYETYFTDLKEYIEFFLNYMETQKIGKQRPKYKHYTFNTFKEFLGNQSLKTVQGALIFMDEKKNKPSYTNKQYYTVYLSALFFLDFVEMFLEIITSLKKKQIYEGRDTIFQSLFNEVAVQSDAFSYDLAQNMNDQKYVEPYIKYTFLTYLFEGIHILDSCSDDTSNVFKKYNDMLGTTFAFDSKKYGVKMDCMKNYILYFFISKDKDSMVLTLRKFNLLVASENDIIKKTNKQKIKDEMCKFFQIQTRLLVCEKAVSIEQLGLNENADFKNDEGVEGVEGIINKIKQKLIDNISGGSSSDVKEPVEVKEVKVVEVEEVKGLKLEIEKLKSEIFLMNLKCALNEALQKQPDIYEYIESCHVNEDTVCDITKYSSSVTNDVLNYALSFENPKFALVQQILTKLKQDNKQDNNKEICELIAASYLKTSEKIKLITTNNNLKDELNSQNVDGTTPMMILLNNIDFDKDSEEIDKIAAFFTDLDLTQENNNGNDGFSILN